jgi:hypothetical protein
MRRALLISALVFSLVAVTAVMPSSSTAFFGRGGFGYGVYSGYAGYGSYGGCGLGYGRYAAYGVYPAYVGYRGYGVGYYGRHYRGRGWYGHRGYRTSRHVAYRVSHYGRGSRR